METPPADDHKLAEAIIYVANQLAAAGEDSRGAVKLNKILWWADFESYRERGHSITGAVYQKLREGPAPVRLLPARRALQHDGSLRIETNEIPGADHPETVVVATRPAVTDAQDRTFLDRALAKFRGMTGAECSMISHESAGWNAVGFNEVIPYETAILRTEPLDDDTLDWARKIATEEGVGPARAG